MNSTKLFLILGAVAALTVAATFATQSSNYDELNAQCNGTNSTGRQYTNSRGDSCKCYGPIKLLFITIPFEGANCTRKPTESTTALPPTTTAASTTTTTTTTTITTSTTATTPTTETTPTTATTPTTETGPTTATTPTMSTLPASSTVVIGCSTN